MSSPRALLVEDDPAIGRTVAFALQREGFEVEHVLLLREAEASIARAAPALVVLDIGLTDGNGLTLCRALRENTVTRALPVLVLSARSEEIDRVLGLELGADDYLAKPFSPRELVARVRALLRRARLGAEPGAMASAVNASASGAAGFEHDRAGQRIAYRGHWLALTRLEYRLLAHLLQSPGRILPRAALLSAAWGDDAPAGDRTVDTHVKTLRAKLREHEPARELIVTHRGLGYALEV
jgi:two-component system, OmpR family, catabolic regulation response regulator CreB